MRGFLSLEPDETTLSRLVETQNRLRDSIARQGVHFTEADRLAPVLISWPFASLDEIERATTTVIPAPPPLHVDGLHARPNDDRPAEIGHVLQGCEALQRTLFEALRELLDPDPPKPAFVRLARVSPPSRKIGIGLRGSRLLGAGEALFNGINLTFWRQNPTGFERCRTMPFGNGGS